VARYLTEADVQKLLTMPLALQWMEEAHPALALARERGVGSDLPIGL
jgi:hypothetical protein